MYYYVFECCGRKAKDKPLVVRLKRDDGSDGRQFGQCGGIPTELALLSLLAAFGAAYGILYTTSTNPANQGRRKKRSTKSTTVNLEDKVLDLVWLGNIAVSFVKNQDIF